jgi:tRNA-modifying protein YgfZ
MATQNLDDPFFCELSGLGLIAVNGADAQPFLHGQVTCDINGLAPGASRYGGYCSPKGRLLATFLAWRTAEGYMLQLPAALREAVQRRLAMFILRAKVKAADATDAYARFGVGGSQAQAAMKKILGAVPAAAHGVTHAADATLLALPGERIEIVVPAAKSAALRDALKGAVKETDARAWELMDIRAGIPTILPATQEAFVPQMVNLDLTGGVSYTKGCYPGQEIVARMHHLGRLKQRAYLAHIDAGAAPQPGDPLYSADFGDQASGTIVNAAAAPSGGYDVLAGIQTASAQAGPVHWKSADGPALAIKPLPYAA